MRRGRVAVVQLRSATGRAIIRELRQGVEVMIDADWLVEGQTVNVLEARIIHG